jgi:hypothetical protein
MRSPTCFIAFPFGERRYDNTKIMGDVEVVTSTSEENHPAANRFAVVKEVPLEYDGPIKTGDILLVHHNVFKFYNDISGKRRSGKSHLWEELFLIDNDQFFMYKQNDKWHPHNRYCFVKPVPPEDSSIFRPTSEEPLMGIMKYPNEYLLKEGVVEGTKVSFTPDSEYEFIVDGEKLYRMYDHQIAFSL